MSLKQRLVCNYNSVLFAIGQVRLPAWLFSAKTKVVLMFLTVVTGFGYIIEINSLSTSGYIIHNYEEQVSAAEEETKKLETEVAELQSMVSIQKRLPELSMTKPTKVTFIDHSTTPVAQR